MSVVKLMRYLLPPQETLHYPFFQKHKLSFFLQAADATISFTKDEAGAGAVRGMLLGINGEQLSGVKTKSVYS